MPYQLGCFNRPWNRLSYEEALAGIAEAGFSHTGLMRQQGRLLLDAASDADTVNSINSAVSAAGLRMNTVLAGIDLSDGVDAAVSELQSLLGNIAAVGGRYFLSCGTNENAVRSEYYEVMRQGAEIGADLGVMVTLKPHGGISMHGRDLAEAAETIDHANFGIYYDPGNIVYYGGFDPIEEARICGPHVVAMCVKDMLGEKDGTQVTPGDGIVDFPGVFATLAEAGFTNGPALIECLGGESYEAITAEAKRAREYLRGIL